MKQLSTLFSLAMLVFAGQAAAVTWQMPTPYGDSTFHTQNIRQFAKDVHEATGGELEIVVHSAGSLVKHPQIKRAVQTGQAQIGESIISLHANEDPLFGLDSLPFVATSYEDAERLWAAQRPAIEKKLADSGLKLLYTVAWPPQGLYTAKAISQISTNGLYAEMTDANKRARNLGQLDKPRRHAVRAGQPLRLWPFRTVAFTLVYCAVLGRRRVRMPLAKLASIFSASTLSGTWNDRWKEP